MMAHYRSKHEDIRYPCDQCDYQASYKGDLHKHIQSQHGFSVSSQCPECGAEFRQRGAMLAHCRSIHEGIRYPCNECDYQATQQSGLKRHILNIHEGIKYPCNQCDYQATDKSKLRKHMKSKHGV